ncbi:LPS export ABC transporter periplasmic protein LptC [Erythrobacter sp. HL-111]|uniref:LPS export ABC transporter periplasmic protein LptC n=1 Tax=Erythrobacter sp. HL-111 TaxID=1798193 RepID=UPI0006DA9A60|nr:LPS export ABC transporter periplasmic protein LptC [Erythrobacter sp. HL-111]KPP86882.1 MAG: lipopolysaccharide export system permease component LptC [Erythrobacteraceae bacterium HL-111]SDS83087.1 lipopolysaccharide export system protein LptC [Erythrobacter sp. HL-111]
MATKNRIETDEARALRSRRQRFAAPGGSHDRLVGFLARALPIGVGIVAGLMVITPLSPRGEVSFLLDRNRVAMIDERLSVDNAMYRGRDDRGRPFSLMAGEAVQRSSVEGLVRMQDLVAQILLPEGPARLAAEGGIYDIDEDVVDVTGAVRLTAADSYSMTARGVSVNIRERIMTGDDGVEGAVPAGTFSARAIRADLAARTVALEGDARLTMIPGELRMPQ